MVSPELPGTLECHKDAEHSTNVALGMAVTLPHVMELLALAKKDADADKPPSGAALSHRYGRGGEKRVGSL